MAQGKRRITPACAGSRRRRSPASAAAPDHPRVRGEQRTPLETEDASWGSPPRARGAEDPAVRTQGRRRITPACAGSRSAMIVPLCVGRDHPRVRGEQAAPAHRQVYDDGSPPRVRGAGVAGAVAAAGVGITPACAGSRTFCAAMLAIDRDHPRVRGEQTPRRGSSPGWWGSPPRARGADTGPAAARGTRGITPACAGAAGAAVVRVQHAGITPACAGSRSPRPAPRSAASDHPRVRGEQLSALPATALARGSPPRARGAGAVREPEDHVPRITPACAGSRPGPARPSWSRRDHPRVRGEQKPPGPVMPPPYGSPPRARGAASRPGRRAAARRITPACAGSSSSPSPSSAVCWDHPRVRGEQGATLLTASASSGSPRVRGEQHLSVTEVGWSPGSPPRARGAAASRPGRRAGPGITPACAGSRPARSVRATRWWDHPRVRGEQTT